MNHQSFAPVDVSRPGKRADCLKRGRAKEAKITSSRGSGGRRSRTMAKKYRDRHWLAVKAMSSCVTAGPAAAPEKIAQRAYAIADAMIEEAKKEPEPEKKEKSGKGRGAKAATVQ
jgi:hypothetical protein